MITKMYLSFYWAQSVKPPSSFQVMSSLLSFRCKQKWGHPNEWLVSSVISLFSCTSLMDSGLRGGIYHYDWVISQSPWVPLISHFIWFWRLNSYIHSNLLVSLLDVVVVQLIFSLAFYEQPKHHRSWYDDIMCWT